MNVTLTSLKIVENALRVSTRRHLILLLHIYSIFYLLVLRHRALRRSILRTSVHILFMLIIESLHGEGMAFLGLLLLLRIRWYVTNGY